MLDEQQRKYWANKENRKKVIRFMLDFVNSNRTEEKSDVIGEYVPIILGVDNNLIDFCRRSLSYAINPKRGSKYNVWVSLVLKNFAEKDRTLEESIALVGKLQDNETIVREHYRGNTKEQTQDKPTKARFRV